MQSDSGSNGVAAWVGGTVIWHRYKYESGWVRQGSSLVTSFRLRHFRIPVLDYSNKATSQKLPYCLLYVRAKIRMKLEIEVRPLGTSVLHDDHLPH